MHDRNLPLVRREVERLHAFLEHWLAGTLAKSEETFERGIASRLHPSFINIQPAGVALARDELLRQIRDGWGCSPDFRIRVRNVRVSPVFAETGALVATYEEYQRGARNSDRPDNARLSTALFQPVGAGALHWLHIHETWLPEAAHDPGRFDF